MPAEQYFKFMSPVDGLMLDAMKVIPEGEPKAVVQIVHGMCEYKERYREFMSFLAELGYLCVIHDHRGHGHSVENPDELGYLYAGGFEGLVEDTHCLTMLIKEELPEGTPYYMLGHSMGSMVARSYLKKYDTELDKLVLSGSPSKPAGSSMGGILTALVGKCKGVKAHSALLDYIAVGSTYEKRYKKEGLPHAWVCSDRNLVERYNMDPYCNYTFTVNGYDALIRLTNETYSAKGWEMGKPELPILFCSGDGDPCMIGPKQYGRSIRFLKERGYYRVRGKLYKDMRHEVLNEPGRRRVYKDIATFFAECFD